MKIKLFLSYFLTFFILFVFYLGLKSTNQYDTENLIGKKISNFEITNLYGSKTIDRNNLLKSEFTLINFWASWCSPCRVEHPILMSLNKDKNLKILGVNFKDNKKNAFKFLERLGNPYHYSAVDKDGRSSVIFGIYGIPESILVNKDLVIIKKFIGPLSNEDYKLIQKIIK